MRVNSHPLNKSEISLANRKPSTDGINSISLYVHDPIDVYHNMTSHFKAAFTDGCTIILSAFLTVFEGFDGLSLLPNRSLPRKTKQINKQTPRKIACTQCSRSAEDPAGIPEVLVYTGPYLLFIYLWGGGGY